MPTVVPLVSHLQQCNMGEKSSQGWDWRMLMGQYLAPTFPSVASCPGEGGGNGEGCEELCEDWGHVSC